LTDTKNFKSKNPKSKASFLLIKSKISKGYFPGGILPITLPVSLFFDIGFVISTTDSSGILLDRTKEYGVFSIGESRIKIQNRH
jgi:hypothetical protein